MNTSTSGKPVREFTRSMEVQITQNKTWRHIAWMKRQAHYVICKMVWFFKSKNTNCQLTEKPQFQMPFQKISSPNLIASPFVKRKRADTQTFATS